MPRILHIFVIICLIGSVAYSYRVKYHSIALHNEVQRIKKDIEKTRNEIAEARAEWQVLNNPERIQRLAELHTTTAGMSVSQIIRWSDLPVRPSTTDPIAEKLMSLGDAHNLKHPAPVALGVSTPKQGAVPPVSPIAQVAKD